MLELRQRVGLPHEARAACHRSSLFGTCLTPWLKTTVAIKKVPPRLGGEVARNLRASCTGPGCVPAYSRSQAGRIAVDARTRWQRRIRRVSKPGTDRHRRLQSHSPRPQGDEQRRRPELLRRLATPAWPRPHRLANPLPRPDAAASNHRGRGDGAGSQRVGTDTKANRGKNHGNPFACKTKEPDNGQEPLSGHAAGGHPRRPGFYRADRETFAADVWLQGVQDRACRVLAGYRPSGPPRRPGASGRRPALQDGQRSKKPPRQERRGGCRGSWRLMRPSHDSKIGCGPAAP